MRPVILYIKCYHVIRSGPDSDSKCRFRLYKNENTYWVCQDGVNWIAMPRFASRTCSTTRIMCAYAMKRQPRPFSLVHPPMLCCMYFWLYTLFSIPVFVSIYMSAYVVPKVCKKIRAFVLCVRAVVCFLQTQSQAGYRKPISQLSDLWKMSHSHLAVIACWCRSTVVIGAREAREDGQAGDYDRLERCLVRIERRVLRCPYFIKNLCTFWTSKRFKVPPGVRNG